MWNCAEIYKSRMALYMYSLIVLMCR